MVILSLAALLSTSAAVPAGMRQPGLFGTKEFHSANLTAFPKWRDALTRFNRELAECAPHRCRVDQWRLLVTSLRGPSEMTQLARLNGIINRYPYVEDVTNWSRADYWATPLQFFDRSGDCEDFAIAKYLALRQSGVPPNDLRVVVVRDRERRVMHAVLAVYVAGQALILDNLRNDIVAADRISRYEPLYSINELGWWLHRR